MGDNKTYIGSALMALFSGLTIVDWTAIIGLAISGGFTAWQFYAGRADARRQYALLQQLTDKIAEGKATPSTVQAVANIVSKTNAN